MRDGWDEKTLDEVCILRNGHAYNKQELLSSGKYPVLRVGNFFTNKNWYYSNLKLDNTKYCDTGDLLYAWSASFGPRIWEGGKVIYHYHIWRVDYDDEQVMKEFLYYWFEWDAESIKKDQGAGTTMVHVSMKSMNARSICLPSLAEQKRIVAILDEASAGIATAIANAEKNLANARELFESHLNAVFSQKGDGWVERTVGDIAQVKGGKRLPKGYKLQTERTVHPYITVTDFNNSGGVDVEGVRFISKSVHKEIARYIISSKDLYISIAGTIGKTGIIPDILDGANLTENACRLVFHDGIVNRFVYYFTRTASFTEQAFQNTRVAAQPKLALSRLKTIRLCVPSLKDQRRVTEKCEALSAEIQSLESIYQQRLDSLAELKQSILQKAFARELTANPDKALAEGAS